MVVIIKSVSIAKGASAVLSKPKKVGHSPMMAVLVSGLTISRLQKQIANPRIQLLVEANKDVNNILYFFCLKQLHFEERRIDGYYWNNDRKIWLQEVFPFPDILYLRAGIQLKYAHLFKELLKAIEEINGQVINYPNFNKWLLYQTIVKDQLLKNYLPDTRQVNQAEDIEKMLQRYNVVYLKSHIGRKGLHVLRVELLANRIYRYSYLRHGLLTVKIIFGFRQLLEVVNKYFSGKKYLIQQAIRLMKLGNRLIDMRAEMQRNGDGCLEIVGISVRLGQPGAPITTHGDAFKFDEFFINQMCYTEDKIMVLRSEVCNFLVSTYEYIEKYYGKYVEIGIDFSIDLNGKIWLIEANSQSTKVSLEKAYDSAVLSRAYQNILKYARYLFNQSDMP